ncbi:MAG: hypothetical protein M0Z28_14435 [Rhodospirillales bacterium]|nr:hypothetical protein [Rhodospirillales bacterium]
MDARARLALPAGIVPAGARLRSDLDVRKVWPSFLVWLLVSVCTLGLGWIVVSGHFFRLLLNSTLIVDAEDNRIGRLECDYDVEADPVRILRWVLLSVATLGIGLLFYSFRAGKLALSATRVVWE